MEWNELITVVIVGLVVWYLKSLIDSINSRLDKIEHNVLGLQVHTDEYGVDPQNLSVRIRILENKILGKS